MNQLKVFEELDEYTKKIIALLLRIPEGLHYNEIQRRLKIPKATLTNRLNDLLRKGLIVKERKGRKYVIYRIANYEVIESVKKLQRHIPTARLIMLLDLASFSIKLVEDRVLKLNETLDFIACSLAFYTKLYLASLATSIKEAASKVETQEERRKIAKNIFTMFYASEPVLPFSHVLYIIASELALKIGENIDRLKYEEVKEAIDYNIVSKKKKEVLRFLEKYSEKYEWAKRLLNAMRKGFKAYIEEAKKAPEKTLIAKKEVLEKLMEVDVSRRILLDKLKKLL